MTQKTSRAVKYHIACPDTRHCRSSDAATLYDDGHIFCYSCGKDFQDLNNNNKNIRLIVDEPNTAEASGGSESSTGVHWSKPCAGEHVEFLPHRGLTRATLEFFNMRTYVGADGAPLRTEIPFRADGWQVRKGAGEHDMLSRGNMSGPGLFFADKFPAGSAQACTITEGAYDAASIFQVLGSKYPVYSVKSASSARADASAARDLLNSFERIYIAFDADEPGRKAAREVASLFDFNKVYEVPLSPKLKDANGYLQAQKGDDLRRAWWNAKRYLPEGIVSSFVDFDRIIDEAEGRPSFPYPFGKLQATLRGITSSEFVLVTAMEGVGKTEFLRSLEYHTLTTTDHKIGCIHIEEPDHDQLKRLTGYHLNTAAHLPESGVSNDDIKKAYREITGGKEERLQLYNHFGSDDPDILLDTVRFMVAVGGAKVVFFDHITMAVTGLESDDERKTLDYLSTKLATMVNDLDFTLFCVSHVNDDGKTRGSRNISKVADSWISLSRDLEHPDEFERNKVSLVVKKNRRAGTTGPAGILLFDPAIHKLGEAPALVEELPVD